MKRIIILAILTLMIVSLRAYADAEEAVFNPDRTKLPEYAPGEVLVKIKDGAAPNEILLQSGINSPECNRVQQIDTAVEKFKKDYKLEKSSDGWYWFLGKNYKEIENIPDEELFKEAYSNMPETEKALYRVYKVTLPDNITVEDAISRLRGDPDVEYAEPNYTVKVEMIPNDPFYSSHGSWENDYDDLWGLKKINCQDAWDLAQGEGVVVAVIDTGVDYTHPDIAANMWKDAGGKYGYDFANKDLNPMDDHGHGTHCAGTIAAVGNNGIGVIGVAPRAKIMAVKGLDLNGSGYIDVLANCVRYAVENKADILSNSWGGAIESQVLKDAFDFAYSQGCISIAAAGNKARHFSIYSPAKYDSVLAVAATDPYDCRASFSNYGDIIAAPGQDILSLRAKGTDMCFNPLLPHRRYDVQEIYYRASGTSMACPHVSGLAALILQRYPEEINGEVMARIIGTSDISTESEFFIGRINAYRALTAERGPVIYRIGDFVLDDRTGNNNANIDCGEEVNMSFELKNIWEEATNVEIRLTTPDENISIKNPLIYLEKISCLEKVTGDFVLVAGENLPQGSDIPFTMTITADGGYLKTEDFVMKYSVRPLFGWPRHIHTRWGFSTTIELLNWSMAERGPAVADINSDGFLEIIYPWIGELYCLNKESDLLWSFKDSGAEILLCTPTAGDIDNDGDIEIIAGGFYGLYCLDKDGNKLWDTEDNGSQVSGDTRKSTSIALSDINNDGNLEIIASRDSHVSCLDKDGRWFWWMACNGRAKMVRHDSYNTIGSFALAGIYGDEYKRIIVGCGNQSGIAANAIEGEYILLLDKDINGDYVNSERFNIDGFNPVIGDMDQDGREDIVVQQHRHNGLESISAYLKCINSDGDIIWAYELERPPEWPFVILSPHIIEDVSGDGKPDVVVGVNPYMVIEHAINYLRSRLRWSPSGYVICVDNAGKKLFSCEIEGMIVGSPVMAEIELGNPMIVVCTTKRFIYFINGEGAVVWVYHLDSYPVGSPSIADIDNNGSLEVIVRTSEGNVSVLGLPYIPKGEYRLLWPMSGHDTQHTNALEHKAINKPPFLGISGPKDYIFLTGVESSLIIKAKDPEGENVTVSIDNAPYGSKFIPSDNSAIFKWLPGDKDRGLYNINFYARDGFGNRVKRTVTITVEKAGTRQKDEPDGEGKPDKPTKPGKPEKPDK